ncbi:MAG: LPS export ABC transporter permease LptG [Pseudomonadota bacterium]
MLIITQYFSKEFIKTFLLCIASFVVLYLLVDLIERLDDMIKNQVPVALIIQYYLCSTPLIIYQLCPFGVLLCTFITIGLFVKHNEILALKAHGISLFRVLKVFIIIAVCVCFCSLWLQEYLLPYTNRQMKEIKNINIKGKKPSTLFKKYHFWYRTQDTIYNIDYFDPDKNMLRKITIFYFDSQFSLKKRIDAQSAVWANDIWLFNDGQERDFFPTGETRATHFKTKKLSINKTPDEFKASRKEGEEMSFTEIRKFTQKMREEGYPSTTYEVDMHAKIAYPFISVIMALLGIPFALRTGRSGGLAFGISLSIVLGFLYWIFFAFCLSLGKGGAIPPFLSAWIANIAFGSLGVYMFLHVRQ